MVYQFQARGSRRIGRAVEAPRSLRQGERLKINGIDYQVAGIRAESLVRWNRQDGAVVNTSAALVTLGTVAELAITHGRQF
jgi:hypothetical protein